jgi:hypothetical protein
MIDKHRVKLSVFVAIVFFTALCALHAQQQAADATAQTASGSKPADTAKAGTAQNAAADSSPAASSGVCTVHPSAGANAASGGSKGGGGGSGSSGAGAGVQVNQYAAAQANGGGNQNTGGGKTKGTKIEVWDLPLDTATKNAAEIAPRLKALSSLVVDAIAIGPSKIVVLLDASQTSSTTGGNGAAQPPAPKNPPAGDAKNPKQPTGAKDPPQPAAPKKASTPPNPKTTQNASSQELSNLKSSLSEFAKRLAWPAPGTKSSEPPEPPKQSYTSPFVFPVALPAGTGKACDIANALVNSNPYINEITAIDDSRLLISLSGSTPDNEAVEDQLKKLVVDLGSPNTPAAPIADTIIQRLYYNHDPKAVATIISDIYPSVAAQALPPDAVVLSDRADLNDETRRETLQSAQRAIARIDQPRPQVSVDAWSLQLATKDPDSLGRTIPKLEDLAGAYNEAIDRSLIGGWEYLSQQTGGEEQFDGSLRSYLTWTTRVKADGSVTRLKQPYASKDPANPTTNDQTTPDSGYGLGFATLYSGLTPNLIDMLVTLVSLKSPRSIADTMLTQMGTKAPDNSRNTCREQDEAEYDKEINADQELRKPDMDAFTKVKGGSQATLPTPPHPKYLQLACVREALVDQLFAEYGTGQHPSTSSLGQMRAALADFLFHYKMMVEYPEDFQSYLEPMAADTLDSALGPIVSAFDDDLSVFQSSLQRQIATAIKREDKGLSYGYGGLVSLKVLSGQPGDVKTATQNYFDVTPPATLNDLLTNLQTEGASVSAKPLSSLVTSLAPAKAVELLTALGQTLTPKTTTAHLGRGLDLDVTAHALSGAIGAELDLSVQSTENGAGLIQAGAAKPTDDFNSRVSQHSVDTHVRVDSINLFRVSTLSSTLARGQAPWKPFDPIEVPVLSLLVKVPKSPMIVHTQSVVFVDAVVVPTAADLGYGEPFIDDQMECQAGRYQALHKLKEFGNCTKGGNGMGDRILQYHAQFIDCLNREYIGSGGVVHYWDGKQENAACETGKSLATFDAVK